MTERSHDRAEVALGMLAMSCDIHLGGVKREAMMKLIRAYGEARFELGRAHESEIVSIRAQEIDRDRQQKELQHRLRERELLREVGS